MIVRRKTKLINGWGINDVDYYVTKRGNLDIKRKITWTCPYYEDWRQIILRCHSKKFKEKHPNYRDCTVCDDWKYFSNFIKWVDLQPNRDWQNCEIDKDLLIEGNKHYSPDICVYIPTSLNLFITNRKNDRGALMLGVTRYTRANKNTYKAQCSNPLTGKQEHLGLFKTELEAHLAWKAKKHEHALKFADIQSDERVAKRLREMYAPETDWTNK